MSRAVVLFLVAFLLQGCDDSRRVGVCTPGATQVCVCAGGVQGAQACSLDGMAWGTCQCLPRLDAWWSDAPRPDAARRDAPRAHDLVGKPDQKKLPDLGKPPKSDLMPSAQVCQASGCKMDSDCTIGIKKCNTATGVCKLCATDADCDSLFYKGGCNSIDSLCRMCKADADCAATIYKGGCNTATGICRMCKADADCLKGAANTGKCASYGSYSGYCMKCTADHDCTDSSLGKYCDTATNTCQMCKTDSDCIKGAGNTGKCALNACIGCTSQTDCDAAFTLAAKLTCK